MVRIEFVSQQAVKSMQRKVSKSYSGMRVSDMVNAIYDEYLSTPTDDTGRIASSVVRGSVYSDSPRTATAISRVEDTFDIRSYVIPYWSPMYTINWLAHRARSKFDISLCDYVFFENSDGHHFLRSHGSRGSLRSSSTRTIRRDSGASRVRGCSSRNCGTSSP